MKIVVTGATGLIGRQLVRELVRAGHRVEAWTRSPERSAVLLPAACTVAGWDPRRVDPGRLARVDAVVHLAGENVAGERWTKERKKALVQSRIGSTRALVAAMAALPPDLRPRSFVCASAIGLYGDRGDDALAETAAPGDGFLAKLCADWERAAFAAEKSGVRVAALRIGVVLAAEGGMLATILPLFRLALAGRIGSGRQWMSWIHLEDVVSLLRFAVEHETVRGPVNAVAPHPVRNRDFTAVLARCLGRPAWLPAPAFALRLAVGEMASVMTSSQRVVPAVALGCGFAFRHPSLPESLTSLCSREAHELTFEQRLDVSVEEAFEFFADARNLERITPPFLHFSILSVPERGLQEGSRIAYRLRLRGFPIHWRTRIEAWDPPNRFADVQERGPYALWHHTHELEPTENGTLVRDRVRYRLPLGALGDLVAGAWVRNDLDEIFRYRHARIRSLVTRRSEAA